MFNNSLKLVPSKVSIKGSLACHFIYFSLSASFLEIQAPHGHQICFVIQNAAQESILLLYGLLLISL